MYLVEFRIQGLGLRVVFIGCAGRYVFGIQVFITVFMVSEGC